MEATIMQTTRYSPWDVVNQMQQELNRLVESRRGDAAATDTSNVVTAQWAPAVDIKEEPDRFVLLVDVPGVRPEDIEVTMEKGVLSIRGERHVERKEGEGTAFQRVERMHGTFYRRFGLPDSADADGIEAYGEHGVLHVNIPKHVRGQARRISVNAGQRSD
jgi:HSP20 family protein